MSLRAGDWLAYDIVVRSPCRFRIVVALKPDGAAARQTPAVAISIDDPAFTSPLAGEVGALAPGGGIRAANAVTGTTDELSAGRHVVRLTGLSSDSLVRWIDVVPADGG